MLWLRGKSQGEVLRDLMEQQRPWIKVRHDDADALLICEKLRLHAQMCGVDIRVQVSATNWVIYWYAGRLTV